MFPLNHTTTQITHQFYYQSPIPFHHNLFLFFSPNTPKQRIPTFLTHQYHQNHIPSIPPFPLTPFHSS
ncbi:DUF2268 domain-containing putative Zn-dependent protease [Bacillus pumilus]|uniref:DUF2268 domain-containing putative Zn-dependent protease n=1 Tax=Bacillus pumilus TaxID=1408 RepID=UPI0034D95D31